jgi:hypothetical protein
MKNYERTNADHIYDVEACVSSEWKAGDKRQNTPPICVPGII